MMKRNTTRNTKPPGTWHPGPARREDGIRNGEGRGLKIVAPIMGSEEDRREYFGG